MVETYPARRAGECPFCGRAIVVGDGIGRVPDAAGVPGAWGCAGCARGAHRNAVGDATTAARRDGRCRVCDRPVSAGERVVPLPPRGVACLRCSEDPAAVGAVVMPRPARSAPGYDVACPACGAAPGEPCVTGAGKRAPVHAARRAAAAGG